nr:DUF5702 domain-containing protein [Pontibacillus sp. HN14]
MKEAFQSESKPPNLASLIKSIRDPYGKWRKTVNTINQDFTTYIPKEYFTENDIAAGKKEKAKDKFKLAKDIFEQGKATYKDKGEYDELQTLLGNYTGSNAISVDEMTSAEGTSKAAVNQMDDLFGNLSEILTGVRDEAYINEYIMTRFKSVQNPSELSSCGNQTPMYKCLPEAYLYSNREVEYIIYGSHQPGINYGYALTELFLTRLALNLAGEFSNNETVKLIPHPWAKFWYALSVALEKTLDNMEVLTSGGEVSFVDLNGYKPDYSMLTDYKFYLRMFLFLHPEGKKIARIQASVDKSTNSDMSKLPTYIKANVESSVDLWFLPGITKLLGRANIVNGDVSNGRYYIETKIVYSY